MELTNKKPRVRHDHAVLRLIALRNLNGETLKDLAREFGMSYRTILYHSVNTGFYLPSYERLKQFDCVIFKHGKAIGLMERKILIGGQAQTVLIPETFLNNMSFDSV
ncbi:MAG: hypothetical protein A4S09_06275 [Proteobacteria bacterium SG_bin7]|nr:MAG: hypothetical protein A4S09_06275 [Proteobacteria bacterium SG_bin7]